MNHIFDPLNLILAAIAIVVLWRLRAVLGQRTGTERPRFDETFKLPPDKASAQVLEFPKNPAPSDKEIESGPLKPVWEGIAPQGSDLALGLEKVAKADSTFQPQSFFNGAKLAYEMVVEAFATGDKSTLKNLLSRDVMDGFSKAIDSRVQAGEKLAFQFVGFEKTEFLSAALNDKRALITVKFLSQMISSTHDRAGNLIDGEPKQIKDVTDIWSFERDVTQKDPNWRVVSTETVN